MSDPAASTRVAAFDIGSNSIKMTIATVSVDGDVHESASMTKTTRLGEGIDKTGRLSDDRIAATIDALGEMSDRATSDGVTKRLGVATEAVLIASNGADFLQTINQRFGISIATISGDEEAALAYDGLAATMPLDGLVIMADIGGASTEIVAATGERKDISQSLPLGSGRLTDRLVVSNPPSIEELHACRDAATATLTPTGVGAHQGGKLYVTGGTGEYMARLIGQQSGIEPREVKGLLRRLTTISAEQVAESADIPVARAKVLPAGIAIVVSLCDLAKPVEVIGAPGGVRTGLLLAAARGSMT
jgi:exopolyphosphatase/guanosine-5'-triphosphate,3'-diphosphate pyrophosphatase